MKTSDLLKALELIEKKFSPEATLSQMLVFLRIAEQEGIKDEEISQQMHIPTPTLRRNVQKLVHAAMGEVWVASKMGYGVCEEKEEDGSLSLSAKGKALVDEISTIS
jgi:DNA-binding MarR family transcriptional regulator